MDTSDNKDKFQKQDSRHTKTVDNKRTYRTTPFIGKSRKGKTNLKQWKTGKLLPTRWSMD